MKPIEILPVEDSPADADLTRECFQESRILNNLHVMSDGTEAMAFVRLQGRSSVAPRPDLILLDVNLPRTAGRQVLTEIKQDRQLSRVPAVVLTASEAEADIVRSYDLHANAHICKPVDLAGFGEVVASIEGFWPSIVKLPPKVD